MLDTSINNLIYERDITDPSLQMKKLRLREVNTPFNDYKKDVTYLKKFCYQLNSFRV